MEQKSWWKLSSCDVWGSKHLNLTLTSDLSGFLPSLHADDLYDHFLFLLSCRWSWNTQFVVYVCEWGCKLRASLMLSQSVCRPRTDSVMSSCVITQHANRNSISSPRLWWYRGRPVCSDRSVSAHCSTVCSKNWHTVGIHTVLMCVCEAMLFHSAARSQISYWKIYHLSSPRFSQGKKIEQTSVKVCVCGSSACRDNCCFRQRRAEPPPPPPKHQNHHYETK